MVRRRRLSIDVGIFLVFFSSSGGGGRIRRDGSIRFVAADGRDYSRPDRRSSRAIVSVVVAYRYGGLRRVELVDGKRFK